MRRRLALFCLLLAIVLALPLQVAAFRPWMVPRVNRYLLNDNFNDTGAAGAVNGTRSDSGALRTVGDTGSYITIGGGNLKFSGGSGAAWSDAYCSYPATTRVAGRTLLLRAMSVDASNNLNFSLSSSPNYSGVWYDITAKVVSDAWQGTFAPSSAGINFSGAADNTWYKLALVARATGAFILVQGGAYPTWTLLWAAPTAAVATLYPTLASYTAAFSVDYLRIPLALWLPTPLSSDGFADANGTALSAHATDGAGHAETSGVGAGGGGQTWVHDVGCWAIQTNKAVGTPTLGAEMWDADAAAFTAGTYAWVAQGNNTIANVGNALAITYVDSAAGAKVFLKDTADLNANLAVGTWYSFSAAAVMNVGSASAYLVAAFSTAPSVSTTPATITTTFVASSATGNYIITDNLGAGEVMTLDNLTLKPLAFSSLFSSIVHSTADVLASVDMTTGWAFQSGIVNNLDSASSPANFILAYINRGDVKAYLDEYVAGVRTNKINGAITYSAGATLRVIRDGTYAALYYNNALVGSSSTMTANTNTLHGKFSTSSSNSLDNWVCYPRKGYTVPE